MVDVLTYNVPLQGGIGIYWQGLEDWNILAWITRFFLLAMLFSAQAEMLLS